MNKKTNIKFNIGNILDIAAYGILAMLFSVLQTTLVPRFQIFDALPDLLIGVICYLGIYRGEKTAGLFGLFAGLCVDGLGNTGVSFLPLFYTIGGYVCGIVGKVARENAKFVAFLISVPAFSLARTSITFLDFLITNWGNLQFQRFFLYTALPEFISTLLICLIVYFIVKLYDSPLNYIRKRGGLY